jgi:hypothetical protein
MLLSTVLLKLVRITLFTIVFQLVVRHRIIRTAKINYLSEIIILLEKIPPLTQLSKVRELLKLVTTIFFRLTPMSMVVAKLVVKWSWEI